MVINTDKGQREMSRSGDKFIAIRIFTDEKMERSGHYFDVLVTAEDGKRTLFVNGKEVDKIEHARQSDTDTEEETETDTY